MDACDKKSKSSNGFDASFDLDKNDFIFLLPPGNDWEQSTLEKNPDNINRVVWYETRQKQTREVQVRHMSYG